MKLITKKNPYLESFNKVSLLCGWHIMKSISFSELDVQNGWNELSRAVSSIIEVEAVGLHETEYCARDELISLVREETGDSGKELQIGSWVLDLGQLVDLAVQLWEWTVTISSR